MTAQRPSAFRDRMARQRTQPAAEPAPVQPPPEPSTPALSKFTVLLDGDEAVGFDRLALDVRRLLGRSVAKSELVRALVALAADDATLRDQVVADLRSRPPRRHNGIPS